MLLSDGVITIISGTADRPTPHKCRTQLVCKYLTLHMDASLHSLGNQNLLAGLLLLLGLMAFAPRLAASASASLPRQLTLVLATLVASGLGAVATTLLPNSYAAFMVARSVQGFMAAIYL